MGIEAIRRLRRILWPKPDLRAPRSDDNVVQFFAWLFGVAQTALNVLLYSGLTWLFARRRKRKRPWKYTNYVYVGVWSLLFLASAFAAPHVSGWGQLVIVSLALWRAAEILTWYVKLLLDKGHRVFLEVERNLLFFVVDVLTFVTAVALMLETASEGDFGRRWSDAFSAFTLSGIPAGYDSPWATAASVVAPVGGLVLLAAGLGIIVNLVSARIKAGKGQPYRGPSKRPPPPWE